MRLVEFVGPPCAGKSTAAAHVLRLGGRGWRDARLLARRERFPGARAIHTALPRRLAATPVADLLLGAPDETGTVRALAARDDEWQDLLARASRRPGGSDPLLATLSFHWAIEAIRLRARIEAARTVVPPGTHVLLDEGLTHPYKLAALCDAEDPDDVAALLARLPLPDALVRFDVPRGELEGRLRARRAADPTAPRERTWSSDESMRADVDRALHLVDAVAAAARSRGVPVVRVDGTAPVAVTARAVLAGVERSTAPTDGGPR